MFNVQWSVPQLPHYLAYLLHSGESGGDEGQTEHILYHSHLAEHGFHAGWVAIDEEQLEQLRELVVNGERRTVLSSESKSNHAAELGWQSVANHADDTYCPKGDEREGDAIVATNHVEVLRLVLNDVVHLRDVAACLLDGYDVLELAGQSERRLSRHVNACSAGHVVEHDRHRTYLCYCCEVLVEAFLRGLVVVGTDAQHAVDALPIFVL